MQHHRQMGFPGYFLIVADFINWAKNNAVPVGPAGFRRRLLVATAWASPISTRWLRLLFERFLNPSGVDARLRRRFLPGQPLAGHRIRAQERYGAQAVSQIATFGTMSSKAVIRDVGRVSSIP